MTTIVLEPSIAGQLKPEAERRGTTVERLANEWLEEQLQQAKREKISAETRRFREMHSELRAKYADKYIAMRDGEVLDQDDDLRTLVLRIRDKYGDEPILITLVDENPVHQYHLRSPRLQRPTVWLRLH